MILRCKISVLDMTNNIDMKSRDCFIFRLTDATLSLELKKGLHFTGIILLKLLQTSLGFSYLDEEERVSPCIMN